MCQRLPRKGRDCHGTHSRHLGNHRIVGRVKKWQVAVDSSETEYFLRRRTEKLMRAFTNDPSDLKMMANIQK